MEPIGGDSNAEDQVGREDLYEPESELAGVDVLARVRSTAEEAVLSCGGGFAEADVIAEAMVAYVDFNYVDLRLKALTKDQLAFERHIVRESLRRYIHGLTSEQHRRWAVSSSKIEHRARQKMLVRADAASLDDFDRAIFDNVYVHGFSVRETATQFGLSHEEIVQRLRRAWVEIRRQFPELFG